MSEWVQSLRWKALQHWWLAPLALAIFVAACWGVEILAKPHYLRWRRVRAIAQARKFLGAHDLNRAGVALQVALRGEPELDVYRLLGDYDEAIGSNQAILARQLASQLNSRDTGLKLELARTALRFSDLDAARKALGSVDSSARATLDYRRAEATYALLAQEWPRAARLLAAIKAEDPKDPGVRLMDDTLNLRNADPKKAEEARADLGGFTGDSAQVIVARRALVADGFSRHRPFATGEAGRALAAAQGATLSDLLDAASAEEYAFPANGADPSLMTKIRLEATANSAAAVLYGRWLLLKRQPDAAVDWLQHLPPNLVSAAAIAELRVEIATSREDWGGLRQLLEQGAWGPVLDNGLEFAFVARILRQRGDAAAAEEAWAEALRECAFSEPSLRALARLADVWRWPDGMQEALFATVRSFPNDEVATRYLIGLLRARHDSRGLLDLLTLRKAAHALTDRQLADWALLSLLVEPRTKPDWVTELLDQLYDKQRDDPYLATDHAFALWQLGRVREACAVVDRLAPDDRVYPARVPYLAVIYGSAGRSEEVQALLRRAPKSADILPEEAALITRAAAMIRR